MAPRRQGSVGGRSTEPSLRLLPCAGTTMHRAIPPTHPTQDRNVLPPLAHDRFAAASKRTALCQSPCQSPIGLASHPCFPSRAQPSFPSTPIRSRIQRSPIDRAPWVILAIGMGLRGMRSTGRPVWASG
ncbi:uncharacterized protein L203_104158 [Cryptococcus depauperatus CBS 7841]|uniref:Uncharacterized protein n=1 Tax=Cryptococcus depauperatus CBS 7841 TaxID=1295531 RepID=A0AAJ8JV04_9TREE